MRAVIKSWNIEDRGPALSTRQEHADGSVTYEGCYVVDMKFVVVGNDANEFLDEIKGLKPGARIQEIQLAATASDLRKKLTGIRNGRKYVFE